MGKSLAEQMAELPEDQYNEVMAGFSKEELENLQYDADFWLRPEQKIHEEDQDWFICAVIAGRGYGKTRIASEWVRRKARENPGCYIGVAGRTIGDVRRIMVEGEALSLDTLVATPTGFITMGDIQLGDTVLGGDGRPCTVTNVFNILENRPCFELDISGTKVIADANHKWVTWTHQARVRRNQANPYYKPSVVTTQEIANTVKFYNQSNHAILNTIVNPHTNTDTHCELPIDPYILGYWLGDGTSKSGEITCHTNDQPHLIKAIERAGFQASVRTTKYVVGVLGLRRPLRLMGLLRNKHIPQEYLSASYEDRLALLQGLIDSDGHVTKRGQVEFSNKNYRLPDGVHQLVSSLGIRCNTGNPNNTGQRRVQFSTGVRVATLPRKVARIRQPREEDRWRYIKSVIPVESVPVRCITVDSDDHTFLITKSYIKTHNSGILAVSPPEERPEFKRMESKLIWPNGSTAMLFSSEAPDSARGPQLAYVAADEFASWKTTVDSSGATLYSNLIAATRLGDHPQMLLTTTPKRTQVMKDINERAKNPKEKIKIIRGSTLENTNLPASFIENLLRQYGDSDLAKQEIYGQMLNDSEGIVFTDEMISRAKNTLKMPSYGLKIIAVDPSVSADPKNADECGIMAFSSTTERDLTKRRGVLLKDYSLRASPDVWVRQVVEAAREQGTKNIVVERNQGGDLVRSVIQAQDPTLKVHTVVATKGKVKRAEPVVVLMQQGRILFDDDFPELEDQLVFYDPEDSNYSPDRLDAFVWAATACMIAPPEGLRVPHASVYNPSKIQLPSHSRGNSMNRNTSSVKRLR